MKTVGTDVIGKGMDLQDTSVDNLELIEVNAAIRYTVLNRSVRSCVPI